MPEDNPQLCDTCESSVEYDEISMCDNNCDNTVCVNCARECVDCEKDVSTKGSVYCNQCLRLVHPEGVKLVCLKHLEEKHKEAYF